MKLSTFVGFGMGALTAAIAAKKLDEASGAKKRRFDRGDRGEKTRRSERRKEEIAQKENT